MKRRRRQRQRMLVLLGAVVLLAVVLIVIISSCSKKNQGAGITAQAFSTGSELTLSVRDRNKARQDGKAHHEK